MPFPYSSAVLTYVADASVGVAPADLAARMQSCDLGLPAIMTLLGLTLTSDVTSVTATGAQRVVTFALGEAFNATLQASAVAGADSSLITTDCGDPAACAGPSIPDPPLASASGYFQNLYTHALQQWCSSYGPAGVRQLPPIVT